MKKFICGILAGLIIMANPVYAELTAVKSAVSGYFISGDEGRFREDNIRPDKVSGGIESLSFSSENVEFSVRALADYDYGISLSAGNPDDLYFNLENRTFESYYDGSNESWDPTLYSLTEEFADWKDDKMKARRSNSSIEVGKSLTDWADIILGWDRWSRNGKEVLLRGSRAYLTTGSLARLRSIPAIADVDGQSDTYHLMLPFSLGEKYNFAFKQSYEYYRDDQDIRHYRYKDGDLQQARTFLDYPKFRDFQTRFTFDSFLSQNLYINAGYMFNYLNNETTRTSVRPNLATSSKQNHFINPEVENIRRSNVFNLGFITSKLGIKGLQLKGALRTESADTQARGGGYSGGTDWRDARSDLRENWFSESFSLVYKGLSRTSVSMDLDLEQRRLQWDESFDARSHEIVTDFSGPDFLSYEADINFNDISWTAKIIHRLNNFIKLNFRYKIEDREREYDISQDTSRDFYPGVLGSQDRDSNEITAQCDIRLFSGWHSSLKYQNISENISFNNVATDSQDMDMQRYSASLFGSFTPKLSFFMSGAIEQFLIDTPTDISDPLSDWQKGDGIYDYSGDYYLFNTALNYSLNNRTSIHSFYQQTYSQGDNKNRFFEWTTSVKRTFESGDSLQFRYEYYNFQDENGGGFDDYNGHGIYLAFDKRF